MRKHRWYLNRDEAETMIIRQCKRNKTSNGILKRIVDKLYGWPNKTATDNCVAKVLIEFVIKYKLYRDLLEFILETNPNNADDTWRRELLKTEVLSWEEHVINKCVSLITCSESAKFPGYIPQASYRNHYKQQYGEEWNRKEKVAV